MLITKQRGFTLIELAISMIVITLLLGSMLLPMTAQRKHRKITETQQQLKEISELFILFVKTNKRLPCPATTATNGGEDGGGANNCNTQHGYVPGSSLGIMGAYDTNNLLLDSWGRPIRYSITTSDNNGNNRQDFTRDGELTSFADANALAPDLVICRVGDPAAQNNCTPANTMISNAPYVLYSLGGDWANFNSSCQRENAESAQLLTNDRVFCITDYSIAAGNEYDDVVFWGNPYSVFDAAQ